MKRLAVKFLGAPMVALLLGLGHASMAVGGELLFTASFDESPEGPYNDYEASRFLNQTTFGATVAEIRRLRQMGYNAWLNEQFAMPLSAHRPYLQNLQAQQVDIYHNIRHEAWMQRAMTAPDQLRQRVMFALSEILVTSDQSGALEGQPFGLSHYYDSLGSGAFGNYRSLLENVTLHPVMGHYLSMFGNRKPDPAINLRPDENYAREIMQLFSIGLVQLNLDGTRVLVGGQPVPTYNQETIAGFAHVFTGWKWFNCPANNWQWCGPGDNGEGWLQPMAPNVEFHAVEGSKQLLNYSGVTLPGGVMPAGNRPSATVQTVRDNMTTALNNIFNHPNVGPFFSKLLIQRLVSSNPSPAYVQRVATVFNNNGSGVRGDLRAVVRAIVMDAEARARPVTGATTGGKMREQPLRWTQIWRAFGASDPDGRFNDWYLHWPYHTPVMPLHSPTVFNFYLPNYAAPGPDVAQAGLLSPEFQIETDTYVTRFSNLIEWFATDMHVGSIPPDFQGTRLSFELERGMRNNPDQLLEHLDVLLMGGTMSSSMRTTLRNYVISIPVGDYNGYRRVTDALSLIVTSPEYVIEK